MRNERLSINSFGYNSLIQAKDISEMTNLSSSDISNRKKRNLDFPVDRNNQKGIPIYFYGDVLKWAYAHNIPIYGKQIRYRDIQRLQRETMDVALNISLIGRARGGKSFIGSYFTENSVFMRQALCGGGSDFTQIPTKINIVDTSPFFRCNICEELSEQISTEIKPYVRRPVSIDENAPDFQIAMTVINDWLRNLHDSGMENIDKLVSLELYTRPSEMAREIMDKTGKQSIVLTDTPGVSGDYTFDSLGRQDVVIITMRDENMQEFTGSIKKIAELVGTTPVVYVYRINDSVTEDDEYYEAQENGSLSMKRFEEQIKSAFNRSNSIIMSSLNALHPLDCFLALPGYKSKKYLGVENLFTKDLAKRIISGVGNKISAECIGAAINREKVKKDEVITLLNDIIYIPQTYPVDKESRAKAVDKFKEEKHARVKSQDQYRILTDVNVQCEDVLRKNSEKMQGYTLDDYPEEWKQKLIQYVYQTIERTIKSCPGVGIGIHPWEASPAVTMRTCESIFASELYDELKEFEGKVGYTSEERVEITKRYRSVLKKYNIQSMSWDRTVANPYGIGDLRILAESSLLDEECKDGQYVKDLIRNCAVNGLLYRAAVDIYTDILWEMGSYENEEQVVTIVKKLMAL
ncbi:MAG: hypothetical protein HFG28_10310 [Eubacterium sp.]|nr:hypothetical protein [Eubacterium sp.]